VDLTGSRENRCRVELSGQVDGTYPVRITFSGCWECSSIQTCSFEGRQFVRTTTASVLWICYVLWMCYLAPRVKNRVGFCFSTVLLPTCPCWWQVTSAFGLGRRRWCYLHSVCLEIWRRCCKKNNTKSYCLYLLARLHHLCLMLSEPVFWLHWCRQWIVPKSNGHVFENIFWLWVVMKWLQSITHSNYCWLLLSKGLCHSSVHLYILNAVRYPYVCTSVRWVRPAQ